MSYTAFQGKSAGNFEGGVRAKSISQMVNDKPVPSEYLWIDYPVKGGDYLWKVVREHWGWPEGHNREIRDMVAMIRAHNQRENDWSPGRRELIKIPIMKIADIAGTGQYTWDDGLTPKQREEQRVKQGVKNSWPSGSTQILPTDFSGIPLSQEEINNILSEGVPVGIMNAYEEFRTKRNWSTGLLKFVGGTFAIVGGVALICASGGLAMPALALVIGTTSTTLGVTTAGIGMAQTIAMAAGKKDAADKLAGYKNAGHAIGKSFDQAFGTESLQRVGNLTNIVTNMGPGLRGGTHILQKIWSGLVGTIAAGLDSVENDVIKNTVLYEIYQNPELMKDEKVVNAAIVEIMENKDNFFVKKGLSFVERAVVREVEMRKFRLRKQKYWAMKKAEANK